MTLTGKRTLKALGGLVLGIVVILILATPDFSPIFAHRNRVRVERLCSSVHKGGAFDLPAFQARARADGLYAAEWPDGKVVSVMERYWLMATVICYVDLSNGVVSDTKTIVHFP
jgi:hypothetical protein